MSRIPQTFQRLAQENSRGLIAYLTAGFPSPAHTLELLRALEAGGADIIELGVPFSDPIADGPVIQKASERALREGTNLPKALSLLREFRGQSELPVVIFSYLNPVLRYGFERFANDAAEAGADGVLLTDLNVDAAGAYLAEMHKRGLDTIFLVSQTTSGERLKKLSQSSSGFVYLVSRAGVTGESASLSSQAVPLIERARKATSLPLAVGFGLSKPEHLAAIAPWADAAVVGSAFIRLIDEHQDEPDLPRRLREFTARLKQALAPAAGKASRSVKG